MKLNVSNKTFRGDLEIIFNALKNKENFTFSKSADGEMKILFGDDINIISKCNGEFKFENQDTSDHFYRNQLINSFQYNDDNYFVSVACSCCVGVENYKRMKELCGLGDDKVTWANIFVNGNYSYFVENFIPEFMNHKVVLICNKKANPYNLFKDNLVTDFRVGTNAWKNDYHIIDDIKKYIDENNIENHLFLFAAGPFGNILAYELHKHNNNNTYLDIGSTLDVHFGLGITRGYLGGAPTLNQTCIW